MPNDGNVHIGSLARVKRMTWVDLTFFQFTTLYDLTFHLSFFTHCIFLHYMPGAVPEQSTTASYGSWTWPWPSWPWSSRSSWPWLPSKRLWPWPWPWWSWSPSRSAWSWSNHPSLSLKASRWKFPHRASDDSTIFLQQLYTAASLMFFSRRQIFAYTHISTPPLYKISYIKLGREQRDCI